MSAFDIIFDKTLTITQDGKPRELTVDEALELQTYQAALGGNRMAIRKVLKMIEKREAALAKRFKPERTWTKLSIHHCADNANEALKALGIANEDPGFGGKHLKIQTWATQAALSRPGRRKFSEKELKDIKFFTFNSEKLRWPPGRLA